MRTFKVFGVLAVSVTIGLLWYFGAPGGKEGPRGGNDPGPQPEVRPVADAPAGGERLRYRWRAGDRFVVSNRAEIDLELEDLKKGVRSSRRLEMETVSRLDVEKVGPGGEAEVSLHTLYFTQKMRDGDRVTAQVDTRFVKGAGAPPEITRLLETAWLRFRVSDRGAVSGVQVPEGREEAL